MDVSFFFLYRCQQSTFCVSCWFEEIMIKSTFSRNATKLPPPGSSKKPSLASLAQKLQDVHLSSTSCTECTLPDDGLSNALPNSFTDDVNSIPPACAKYVRRSESVHSNEDCGTVAACISKQDGNEEKNCSSSSLDLNGSWNDCSLEFDRLHVSPTAHKRCSTAKPTPFGRTLSAVPNPLNRADRRKQKSALCARFSYFCQTSAVAGLRRQCCSSDTPTIRPFDFATPSPDDIVRKKQQLAFGKRISAKRP